MNVENITAIKSDITNISGNITDIKQRLNRIDNKMDSDHEKLIEHETRLKNLEKEIFKKGA